MSKLTTKLRLQLCWTYILRWSTIASSMAISFQPSSEGSCTYQLFTPIDRLIMLYLRSDPFFVSHQLGLLGAIQNIGSLCSLPFAPYLADLMGRRSCIILGACLMVMGTIIQTASQTVHMFIGARWVYFRYLFLTGCTPTAIHRWLIGFGLNFAATGAPMLISELAYPSMFLIFRFFFKNTYMILLSGQRGEITSLYNSLWFVKQVLYQLLVLTRG